MSDLMMFGKITVGKEFRENVYDFCEYLSEKYGRSGGVQKRVNFGEFERFEC